MMRQLDRVVIYEYHIVLDLAKEWRSAIKQLIKMTEKEIQIIDLIATLPPRNKGEYPLPGQIIMYCRRIKQAQRLAEVL